MTAPIQHTRLRNRREGESAVLIIGQARYHAMVGFDEDWRPKISGAKAGATIEAILGDAALVISIALQHGISAGHSGFRWRGCPQPKTIPRRVRRRSSAPR